VMYNDLYQDSRRNITLEWDRTLASRRQQCTLHPIHVCALSLNCPSDDGVTNARPPSQCVTLPC
jgi:hypothetical protein